MYTQQKLKLNRPEIFQSSHKYEHILAHYVVYVYILLKSNVSDCNE
jgi:hypothetical protein